MRCTMFEPGIGGELRVKNALPSTVATLLGPYKITLCQSADLYWRSWVCNGVAAHQMRFPVWNHRISVRKGAHDDSSVFAFKNSWLWQL